MKLHIKLTRTLKLYLIVGSSGLAIFAIIFFAVLPLVKNVGELNQFVKDNRVQIEIFERERENLETTQKAYSTIRNDVGELDILFVESGNYLDIITQLEKLAQQIGITQKISVPQSTATGPFTATLTIACNWHDCLTYFAAIEELDFYLSFDDMLMTREGNNINITLKAQTYAKE